MHQRHSMQSHVCLDRIEVHMQGLSTSLSDVLARNASKQPKAADKAPPGYSPVGLQAVGPVQLQSKLLKTTLSNLGTPEEWQYFGKHALPVCSTGFVTLADWLMHDGIDHDMEDAYSDRYQHFRPYFTMLCESPSLSAPDTHPLCFLKQCKSFHALSAI